MSRNVAAGSSPATAAENTRIQPNGRGERELSDFLRRYEAAFRATARRYAASPQDAEDAYQRALELLLTKGPEAGRRAWLSWMHTVLRREALRLREVRQRQTAAGDSAHLEQLIGMGTAAARRPEAVDPAELIERRDDFERFRQSFVRLKRNERRALCLIGEGYSYSEIGQITGWSWTKINRHLAEGRSRLREMLESIESGRRCAELAGPLSRFSDGEATEAEAEAIHDHLQSCLACRATLTSYRVTPARAVALLPAVPPTRSLAERLQEVGVWLHSSLPGRGGLGDAAGAIASGGGGRGGGMAVLAKLAIICVGAGGSTAACVATGVLPAPGLVGGERPAQSERAQPTAVDAPQAPAPVIAQPLAEGGPAEHDDPSAPPADPHDQEAAEESAAKLAERDPREAEFGAEAAGAPLTLPGSGAGRARARPSAAGGGSAEQTATPPSSPAGADASGAAAQAAGASPPAGRPAQPAAETIPSKRPPLAGGAEFAP